MTVVPQTYTATATWTASQLADIYKTAFIDAGLMTDWFDSFLSGSVENRILRVINDGAKTFGTVYYWFMFTTTGAFVHTTSTWNATTHVPTGTQYIDYFSTTTNATTNHATILALTSTTNCTLTRYTSGINSGASFFLLKNSTSNACFSLSHPSYNASSFVDQDKTQFNNLLFISGATATNYSKIDVSQVCHTRASYLGAALLRGVTTNTEFNRGHRISGFTAPGNASGSNQNTTFTEQLVRLPVGLTNTSTTLAANHTPVYTSPSISPYMAALPADFAFIPYYASSSMVVQDKLIVTSGSEEWEMLVVAANTNTDASRIFFCARVV